MIIDLLTMVSCDFREFQLGGQFWSTLQCANKFKMTVLNNMNHNENCPFMNANDIHFSVFFTLIIDCRINK